MFRRARVVFSLKNLNTFNLIYYLLVGKGDFIPVPGKVIPLHFIRQGKIEIDGDFFSSQH